MSIHIMVGKVTFSNNIFIYSSQTILSVDEMDLFYSVLLSNISSIPQDD